MTDHGPHRSPGDDVHVLVLAWEPRPVARVPAWPRVAAVAAALAGDGRRVTVLADPTTSTRVAPRLADVDVDVVTAHGAAPHLDQDDLRTTVTAGALAMQTAGADLAAAATSVHAIGWQATYGAVALAEQAGVPLVATPLRPPRRGDDGDDWAAEVGRWLVAEADVLLVGSQRLAARLRRDGVPGDRLHVAPLPRGATSDPDLAGLRDVLLVAHAAARARPPGPGPGPRGRTGPQ